MTPSSVPLTPLLVITLFCITSCGEQANRQDTESTGSADSTTSSVISNSPPSTIVTTPQNMMVVTHKVADFDKWVSSYESNDSLKLANGLHNYVVGRSLKDPNTLLVALKADDMAKAKAFAKHASLRQAMQKGGVLGAPVISFTTMTFQDTGSIDSDLRSRTTFMVKDWDKWQKTFDSSGQIRKDNGLELRAYGHDVDNDRKVTVVMALTDTAKAYAFWKSDQMKKLQAASGHLGQPQRFVYRVAKRY